MPLKIVIVGAGIAGLATAIAFARHGHYVQVFERRPPDDREQSGSGIQFQPNIVKILERWGMLSGVTKVAHDNEMATWRLSNGKIVARMDYKPKGPIFYGLRSVYKDLFRRFAIQNGAKIFEGVGVAKVNTEASSILLEDGTRIEADLIVGADGSNSKIRRLLFPDHRLHVTDEVTFQIVLPLSLVENDPELQSIVDGVHNVLTVAPSRMVFSSIVPHQGLVDIQLADLAYGQDGLPNEQVYDLEPLKRRFQDYPLDTRKAIDIADSAFKWRIVEVFGLPSWSKANTVLIGDAAHAMTPHAGQGSAMGIEDAAVLSELLSEASSGDDLRPAIEQYENLRQPRCMKVFKLARQIGQTWTMTDSKQIEMRNASWERVNDAEYMDARADENAQFGSPSFQQWLDHYDVFRTVAEVKKQNTRVSKI